MDSPYLAAGPKYAEQDLERGCMLARQETWSEDFDGLVGEPQWGLYGHLIPRAVPLLMSRDDAGNDSE